MIWARYSLEFCHSQVDAILKVSGKMIHDVHKVHLAHKRDERNRTSTAIIVPDAEWSDFNAFLDVAGIARSSNRKEMNRDDHFEHWQFFLDRNNIEVEQVIIAFRDYMSGLRPQQSMAPFAPGSPEIALGDY